MFFSYAAGFYLAVLSTTPAEGKWDFKYVGNGFDLGGSRVLAVTNMSIMVSSSVNFNNKKINEISSYPLHHRLANGSYNLLEHGPYCYRRDDVEVGDLVSLRLKTLDNKLVYCISINICERPGGKVPPDPLTKPSDWQPYHEWVNAYKALEKGKIPVPPHLSRTAWPQEFPAFDPQVPLKDRLKRFPFDRPFSYIEYIAFMR